MNGRTKSLIDEIISVEHEMFMNVKSSAPAPCQSDAEGFRIFRKAQLAGWSASTLESYLFDLSAAKNSGMNLMTLKYGYMDRSIPYMSNAPEHASTVEKIVAIEKSWQLEILRKYPRLLIKGRPINDGVIKTHQTSFVSYLRGELQTYSLKTLKSLLEDISELVYKDLNRCELVYESIVGDLGYTSIEEANREAARRKL